MKKNLFFLLIGLVLFSSQLSAQAIGIIKGKLIDTVLHQSLKDASIKVLHQKDSSVLKASLANDDGSFEIKNIPNGNYIVIINFQSYKQKRRHVSITSDDNSIDLGTLYLSSTTEDLPDVVVTESPIKVKKDTIEYNASSFKTKPNAVAEDLLKKLPGVDVASDGSIKAQGETVSRVLVNGKRFFGDDPKMATKNLPPDVIDKIQVFDDLSDQSKFTGFDDGNRVKTINITTKKGTNKGYFGRAVAGIGDDSRYDESLNIHRFNDDQQISVLGQANNVNKQNFSQADILGGGPRGGRGGGSSTGSGITNTLSGGLNMKDSWGKLNSSAYGSYFYNRLETDLTTQSLTQTLLSNSDSSSYKSSNSTSHSFSPSHAITFNLEENFDSSNSLVFRPNISFQSSSPYSSSNSVSTLNGDTVNTSVSKSSSNSSGFNIGGTNLQLRHRFAKKYRTISIDFNFSASSNNGTGYNYSITPFFQTGNIDTINQYYTSSYHSYSFSPTVSYTEPIGKNQILEFRYNLNYNKNESVSNTNRFNNATGDYTIFDSLYSNSYHYTSTSHTGTISYRLQQPKYNFNIGTGVQWMDYKSDNLVKNVTVANNVVNFTPTANFMYNFSKTQNLRFFYTGRTGQPSVSNLQPIRTINGIDTTFGNSGLKPQFTNSVRLLYSNFDAATQRVIFATINASMTSNDIQNFVTYYIHKGTQYTTYANLNGTYNINGYFNYGFSLKKPKSNLNFTTNIGYNQAQTLIAYDTANFVQEHNYTRNTNLGETIKWTTNINNFDLNLSTGINYTIANYSLYPNRNSNYFTYNAGFDVTYYSNSGWIVASDFSYSYNGQRAAGYNASIPLITPSIAKQFLKNKRGELRLTVFDVLNQNQSVSRNISSNTITDSRSNVLTRYFMLTFTFNLRNFAGQQQQRMPGLFRGARPDGMPPPDGGFPRGGGFPGGGRRGGF